MCKKIKSVNNFLCKHISLSIVNGPGEKRRIYNIIIRGEYDYIKTD